VTHDQTTPAPAPDHPSEQLSALLDDELDAVESASVTAHLQACPSCRIELADLDRVRTRMRALPAMAAPPGFLDRVVTRRRRANRGGVAVAVVAAALAVVVGLVAADPANLAGGGSAHSGRSPQQAAAVAPPTSRPAVGSQEGTAGHGPLPPLSARRPDPDDKLTVPARRPPPATGGEGSLLDRAHEIGRELLELVGG
jgi:anti-sigma factor RsiW